MAINQLENISKEFEESVDLAHSQRRKTTKSLLNNAGIIVGVFILFAVVVIVTTDIRLATWADVAGLGIDFFLLFIIFCRSLC